MPDDQVALIRRAQRGDAAACAALYDEHYDAVYRYCYYRVGDTDLAQDLAAEVFVRMVEKLDIYQVRGRPLLAWLYTIARNLVVDTHRANGRMMHISLDQAEPAVDGNAMPVDQVARRLEAECLAAAMARLTEDQRQVILGKFVEGRTNAQMGALLNKTEGAIKSLQHRALAALRRALEIERCYEV
ncbi:MAG TPA: sigma-70 family RNA polymerase sigma factor [Anaerolineae bacterium]|nr:sigma-70 family RNA polymerase sigma factor [Anaerolineae bacterium]